VEDVWRSAEPVFQAQAVMEMLMVEPAAKGWPSAVEMTTRSSDSSLW